MKLDALINALARAQVQPQVEIGTVGWEGFDSHFEKGDPNGNPGERHTLVRVTLFRGKDPTKPAKEGVAQGYEILACISGGLFRIPKKGTLVYVIVPHGMESLAGAACIIATREDDPPIQFEEDRAVLSFGDDVHVVIRGKSASLQDPSNRFVSVGTPRSGGTPGIIVQATDGSGGVVQEGVVSWFVASSGDAKSLIQMTTTGVELVQKDSGFMRLKGGEIVALSNGNATLMCRKFFAGPNPTAGVPALVGAPPGAPSLTCFLGAAV